MIFSPFSLDIVPMQKLFLTNFEKDPDELYHALEPQWFDDPDYGRGLRVVAWRKDGYVDVYQQPDLPKDEDFSVAAKGLGDLIVRPMAGSYFTVSEKGVDACFAFTDKTGREIDVKITEKNPRPTKPFTLLAPVGSSSEKPVFFPFYLMNDFDFVRRSMTEVRVCINGKLHKPDTFPVPLNGSKIYFMRYSNDTFLVNWCPAYKGPLKPFSADNPEGIAIDADQISGTINSISAGRGQHSISVSFAPPFPEITGLQDRTTLQGQFVIKANKEEAGRIRGTYLVIRDGDDIQVKMHPMGGWESKPGTLFLKFLFRAVSIFRNWPKTYLWTAAIKLRPGEPPLMESGWSRVSASVSNEPF
jgi:hypothetical protein